jgi:hypothetical protein
VTESYLDVLTQAVDDMVEHGYDDPTRVARWQARLEEAARAGRQSLSRMTDELREGLRRIYDGQVGRDQILRYHGGVDRFTYQRLKPRLRNELDRRLMASMELIKLNREEMINRQAKRFAGWATSLPAGGPAEPERAQVKAAIRKPLASLPFEERRVMIDQGHKLVSALHEVISTEGGAIAGKWRAVHQPGYDHRPEHLARDGRVFIIRGSWAARRGLVVRGPYVDEIERPGEKIFCRCMYVYYYNLRQLPAELLTAAGRAALELVRQRSA